MRCQSCDEKQAISSKNEINLYLCMRCTNLLESMALRPDMWFRIARILGPSEAMIHDDFYNSKGLPIQSDIKFDEIEYNKYIIQRGAPYKNVENFLDDLLTDHIWADEVVIPENLDLKSLKQLVFKEINESNCKEHINTLYDILSVLPSTKAICDFIINNWDKHHYDYWGSITLCLIRHLPVMESQVLIGNALLKNSNLSPCILDGYENEFAIDLFLQIIIKNKLPLVQNYGLTVRSSNPSWEKLKKMIRSGRPASLLAIDSLWVEGSTLYARYFKFKNLKSININLKELNEILDEYVKIDSVPRVKNAIKAVKNQYKI